MIAPRMVLFDCFFLFSTITIAMFDTLWRVYDRKVPDKCHIPGVNKVDDDEKYMSKEFLRFLVKYGNVTSFIHIEPSLYQYERDRL